MKEMEKKTVKRATLEQYLKDNGINPVLTPFENQRLDSQKDEVCIGIGDGKAITLYEKGGFKIEEIPNLILLTP